MLSRTVTRITRIIVLSLLAQCSWEVRMPMGFHRVMERLSCLMPRRTCPKRHFSKHRMSLTQMPIYRSICAVTSLDSVTIQPCIGLTAWTSEEASRPRIPRRTQKAARSSYFLQELFPQGLFSRDVFFHVRFLSHVGRLHSRRLSLCPRFVVQEKSSREWRETHRSRGGSVTASLDGREQAEEDHGGTSPQTGHIWRWPIIA